MKDETNRYEKILYKNNVKLDLDSVYKSIKAYNNLDTSSLKNISKDSLNHLFIISEDLQNYNLANSNADSLLIALLNKKPDWASINTYNIGSP